MRFGPQLSDAGIAFPAGPNRPNSFAVWAVAIGLAVHSNMTFFLAGAKFTVIRLVITLLVIPALVELLRRGRHLGATDLFTCALCAWLLIAVSQTDQSWSSTAALITEFGGAYLVARAFFFGRPALETFVRALKVICIGLIAIASLEQLSQSHVGFVLFGLPIPGYEYRYGWLRAFSTFPHPILYGTFCAAAGAIFLYSERSFLGRVSYGGLCFFGCLLAMSSAPLIALVIAICVRLYDGLLHAHRWRWQVLVTGIFALLVGVFFVANRPVSWIVANLTLDPSTGYFRVATWDTAFYYIGLSPYVGYGFDSYAPAEDFFGNVSVDSTWLVMVIRFGIPSIIPLLLANVASFWPGQSVGGRASNDPYVGLLCTAFTLSLFVLMFVGLTVHYWNNVWLFWGLCLGIRASLREHCANAHASLVLDDPSKLERAASSAALIGARIPRTFIRP